MHSGDSGGGGTFVPGGDGRGKKGAIWGLVILAIVVVIIVLVNR